MSNKSGYEIRADILKMAKETVWDRYHMTYQRWIESKDKKEDGTVIDSTDSPSIPTSMNIIEEAIGFYAFVNQKEKRSSIL